MFLLIALSPIIFANAKADVSHIFTPNYAIFPQHPFQFAFPAQLQTPQQQQSPLPSLYGPPPPAAAQPPASDSYPNPVTPSTAAPVAPTEFTLPEIVENRNAKDHINFIPLHAQYLPPDEQRPNYESPKPPNHQANYYYPRPSSTTTTTTERPSPIIVVEPEPLPPFYGYDYNAPPPPPPPSPTLSRPSTPAPVYLPPPPAVITSNKFASEENSFVENQDSSSSLRARIKEMRCLNYQHGGYFRAALKVDSFISAAPGVDNDATDRRCELKIARSYVLVDIAAEDFEKCGVQTCGRDLCLRLRFPAIRGMRTGSDAILTLHCKIQERIAVKTHALKVGVANDVQARSIGTYAKGGSQNPFRTHIELLRKTKNGFTRHLETNGAVQLGEDLLLRAHVLSGDGWNYTKLSDVSLQRISPSGELLHSANLVTPRGCINPSMQSICGGPPTYDPPLGHKLQFKAVMFQGMHSGDELVMSMRITACLEHHDCYVNHEECDSKQFVNTGRRRRDTDIISGENSTNHVEVSEISRISFRVIMEDINLDEDTKEKLLPETSSTPVIMLGQRVLILVSSVGFVMLITCLGVVAAWKLKS